MAYVVTAFWRAKDGQEDTVAQALVQLTRLSRTEPGCLFYQAHRSPDDPRLFFIYEQYRDAAAFEAHITSPHFEQYGRGTALPVLESRERAFYETIDV